MRSTRVYRRGTWTVSKARFPQVFDSVVEVKVAKLLGRSGSGKLWLWLSGAVDATLPRQVDALVRAYFHSWHPP
jgi:hypothetical protein